MGCGWTRLIDTPHFIQRRKNCINIVPFRTSSLHIDCIMIPSYGYTACSFARRCVFHFGFSCAPGPLIFWGTLSVALHLISHSLSLWLHHSLSLHILSLRGESWPSCSHVDCRLCIVPETSSRLSSEFWSCIVLTSPQDDYSIVPTCEIAGNWL